MKTHIRTNGAAVKTEDGVAIEFKLRDHVPTGELAIDAVIASDPETRWPGVIHLSDDSAEKLFRLLEAYFA